jgi:hypothetical protein
MDRYHDCTSEGDLRGVRPTAGQRWDFADWCVLAVVAVLVRQGPSTLGLPAGITRYPRRNLVPQLQSDATPD